MNNLTHNQQGAKQALLDDQQAQMILRYQNADARERAAIFRQIDGFLPTLKGDQKSFWLSFRQSLERTGEKSPAPVKKSLTYISVQFADGRERILFMEAR